jgi:hypothetical protein
VPGAPVTTTYSSRGCTAIARLLGSVHGVVVQIQASAPAAGAVESRKPTVTAGSCR